MLRHYELEKHVGAASSMTATQKAAAHAALPTVHNATWHAAVIIAASPTLIARGKAIKHRSAGDSNWLLGIASG